METLSTNEFITRAISLFAILISVINFIYNRKQNKKKEYIAVDTTLDDLFNQIRLFDRLEEKPNTIENRNAKAQYLYEAKSKLSEAKKLKRNYSRVIEYDGVISEIEGNIGVAYSKYKQACTLKPTRWQSFYRLGRITADPTKQIQLLEKVIRISPQESSLAHYELGRIYITKGKTDKAISAYTKALELERNNPNFYFALAKAHETSFSISEAVSNYKIAYRTYIESITTMVHLGAMLIRNKTLDDDGNDGFYWIEKAKKTDPKDSYPNITLAYLYYELDKPEDALTAFNKAIEIDSNLNFSMINSEWRILKKKIDQKIETKQFYSKGYNWLNQGIDIKQRIDVNNGDGLWYQLPEDGEIHLWKQGISWKYNVLCLSDPRKGRSHHEYKTTDLDNLPLDDVVVVLIERYNISQKQCKYLNPKLDKPSLKMQLSNILDRLVNQRVEKWISHKGIIAFPNLQRLLIEFDKIGKEHLDYLSMHVFSHDATYFKRCSKIGLLTVNSEFHKDYICSLTMERGGYYYDEFVYFPQVPKTNYYYLIDTNAFFNITFYGHVCKNEKSYYIVFAYRY